MTLINESSTDLSEHIKSVERRNIYRQIEITYKVEVEFPEKLKTSY